MYHNPSACYRRESPEIRQSSRGCRQYNHPHNCESRVASLEIDPAAHPRANSNLRRLCYNTCAVSHSGRPCLGLSTRCPLASVHLGLVSGARSQGTLSLVCKYLNIVDFPYEQNLNSQLKPPYFPQNKATTMSASEDAVHAAVGDPEPESPTEKYSWHRGVFFNATVVGIAAFAAPGLWNAMNSVGAGGQQTPYLVMYVHQPAFFVDRLLIQTGRVMPSYSQL